MSNVSESGNEFKLGCWFLDQSTTPFVVIVKKNATVHELKILIKKEKKHPLPAHTLNLWKLSSPIHCVEMDLKIGHAQSPEEITGGCVKLGPLDELWDHFSSPPRRHLHIVVMPSPERSPNRRRVEDGETLHTPIRRLPCIYPQDLEPAMARAFEPFTKYITYLAKGNLDGYFNSTRPEDLVNDLEVGLPSRPMLLLHDLGESKNEERINHLFIPDTVHLFAGPGSGKTRLALEGLCLYWGFYISCGGSPEKPTGGSSDFLMAIQMTKAMTNWNGSDRQGSPDSNKNVGMARRVFAMLICARVFVLKRLLEKLPNGTNAKLARQRWVLAQALPPSTKIGSDIFSVILQALSLCSADTLSLQSLTRSMLQEITKQVGDEVFPSKQLFAVIDEAQIAAEYLPTSFCSFTMGIDVRPVLHAFHEFLLENTCIQGVILAGTGLPKTMVPASSRAAQYMNARPKPIVFVEVGRFTKDGRAHEDYIRKYLPLSPTSISDRRLVERILHWFSGRYQFTASLIELLRYTQPTSRHRVLSAFAYALTGFSITDAIDLEEHEPPLTAETQHLIDHFDQIHAMHRLLDLESDREGLIRRLTDVLMRWRIGSQASTSNSINGYMHEAVALGIGHLDAIGLDQTMDQENYPVYLCEPLVLLHLSSVFESYSWTRSQAWIVETFRTARNRSTKGFILEDAAALMLVLMFGGQSRPLSDVFRCNQPWGSRKVSLVSLKLRGDGVMQCCPVSWNSGSSDCWGYKASSPADVLAFFDNPNGKAFLFPNDHMGPDLLFFLRDEDSGELILVGLQTKFKGSFDNTTWLSALNSIMPQFFYTVNTNGGEMQYAPYKYPYLVEDITNALDSMLGPGEYRPLVEKRYHLPSSTFSDQTFAYQPPRKTSRYLWIIATPDDEQDERLKVEQKVDVGVFRWDCMLAQW